MAREFQKSFDDIAREAELDELRAQVDALKNANPMNEVKKALDPNDELAAIDHDLQKAVKDPAEETDRTEPKDEEKAS